MTDRELRQFIDQHNAKAEQRQRIIETIQDFIAFVSIACLGVVMTLLCVAFGA